MRRRWVSYRDVIERHARRVARDVASQIRSARPRKRRRGAAGRNRGPIGGSLSDRVRSRDLVVRRRWGAVIQFSELGQKLLWFRRGTKRQPARPLRLMPDETRLAADVREDAIRHYEAADQRATRGRR